MDVGSKRRGAPADDGEDAGAGGKRVKRGAGEAVHAAGATVLIDGGLWAGRCGSATHEKTALLFCVHMKEVAERVGGGLARVVVVDGTMTAADTAPTGTRESTPATAERRGLYTAAAAEFNKAFPGTPFAVKGCRDAWEADGDHALACVKAYRSGLAHRTVDAALIGEVVAAADVAPAAPLVLAVAGADAEQIVVAARLFSRDPADVWLAGIGGEASTVLDAYVPPARRIRLSGAGGVLDRAGTTKSRSKSALTKAERLARFKEARRKQNAAR